MSNESRCQKSFGGILQRRIQSQSTCKFTSDLVKDEIDVFGDVYLGAFSRRSAVIFATRTIHLGAVVESTYCNSTLSIRFADGWYYSPDWSRKKELLEERGDDLYYFYEDSGFGSQFFINWRFYQ